MMLIYIPSCDIPPVLRCSWPRVVLLVQEPPADCWMHGDLDQFVAFVHSAIAEGKLRPDPLIPIQVAPCRKAVELARKRFLDG